MARRFTRTLFFDALIPAGVGFFVIPDIASHYFEFCRVHGRSMSPELNPFTEATQKNIDKQNEEVEMFFNYARSAYAQSQTQPPNAIAGSGETNGGERSTEGTEEEKGEGGAGEKGADGAEGAEEVPLADSDPKPSEPEAPPLDRPLVRDPVMIGPPKITEAEANAALKHFLARESGGAGARVGPPAGASEPEAKDFDPLEVTFPPESTASDSDANDYGPGASDYILVNKWATRDRSKLEKGWTYVLFDPTSSGRICIKRLVALEGDTIYTSRRGVITIPEGHAWFEGDNHVMSEDSEVWGPIPVGLVQGRADLVVYPFKRVQSMRRKDLAYRHLDSYAEIAFARANYETLRLN